MYCHGPSDSLEHVWSCPSFLALLSSVIVEFSCPPLPASPISRLGLANPSPESLLVPAAATLLYHQIRSVNNGAPVRPERAAQAVPT
eukprot:836479-Pyramimonas_sp.AAC.1